MNNQPKFIKYTPTPNDKYNMLGIAEILVDIPVIIRYKHVKSKDGSGSFFCPPSLSTEDSLGEKKYMSVFEPDIRKSEEELLQEFIRNEVHKALSQKNGHQSQPQPIQYPHGMCQPTPTSMSDLPMAGDCPF